MAELQAHRHAPGLKVVVYDGVSRKTPKDEDQESKKRKSRKSFKKMSREEKFKASIVRPVVLLLCLKKVLKHALQCMPCLLAFVDTLLCMQGTVTSMNATAPIALQAANTGPCAN